MQCIAVLGMGGAIGQVVKREQLLHIAVLKSCRLADTFYTPPAARDTLLVAICYIPETARFHPSRIPFQAKTSSQVIRRTSCFACR